MRPNLSNFAQNFLKNSTCVTAETVRNWPVTETETDPTSFGTDTETGPTLRRMPFIFVRIMFVLVRLQASEPGVNREW